MGRNDAENDFEKLSEKLAQFFDGITGVEAAELKDAMKRGLNKYVEKRLDAVAEDMSTPVVLECSEGV